MENDTDPGLAFDHPLLDKLNPIDRIMVTSHYASLIQNGINNVRILEILYTINLITVVINTATTFDQAQKVALYGLGVHLQKRVDELIAQTQSDENA